MTSFVGQHPRCDVCGGYKEFGNGPFGTTVEYCPKCEPTPSPFTIVRSSGQARLNRPGLALPINTISHGNDPSGLARREREFTPPTRRAERANHTPQRESSDMRTFDKKCNRSGKPFTSKAPAARYCGVCTECKAAAGSKAPNTGFRSELPPAPNRYDGTIGQMREELEALDRRRAELLEAIGVLERLGAA